MRRIEPRVPPVVVLLSVAGSMWAAARLGFRDAWTLPNAWVWAAVFAALGAGVALGGVVSFRRHQTTVNPVKLQNVSTMVRTGIYARSRNPMYLGMALALVGWALLLDSALAWLGVPLFVAVLTRWQILPEERWLRERFGTEYVTYCAEVRRWL